MRAAVAALLALVGLGGCVTHYGPVTVERTVDIGLVHTCLSHGVGIQWCEHIHFDPGQCALVIVYPKAPSPGLRGVLEGMAKEDRAECLSERTP